MFVCVFKTIGFYLVARTFSKREFYHSLVSGGIRSRLSVAVEQMEGKTKTTNAEPFVNVTERRTLKGIIQTTL